MFKLKLAILSLIAGLMMASPAMAHKVNVFGYVENGIILGEGYFPGGGKAKSCKIELLDSSGKVLTQTKTDAEGAFKIKLPQAKPPLKLVLYAGMGHKGEYILTAQDIGQEEKAAGAADTEKRKQVSQIQEASKVLQPGVDEQVIREIVAKELEKQIAPLRSQIARMNADREIGVADVIGGLGYILGLLGLAAYMKYRKQK